jgi:predicted nucleotide-binding protein
VVKVLIREGQLFSSDTPIALIKLNIWESSAGVIGANQRRVFLVHGHGHLVNHSMEQFLLEHQMKTIVLNQEPGKGRTIIERFEQSADVGFAVVVLTPDDMGADRTSATLGRLLPRARQNVILELGYFIARLGRNRVCALKSGDVELPSDVIGVSYVDFDETGTWRSRVTRELAAAGYTVDLSKMAAFGN